VAVRRGVPADTPPQTPPLIHFRVQPLLGDLDVHRVVASPLDREVGQPFQFGLGLLPLLGGFAAAVVGHIFTLPQ
jgi:hypothetical protein